MKLGSNNTLGYRGRLVSLLFVGILILFMRTMVILQFGVALHHFPFPAIIAVIVAWQIGKSYDKYIYLSMKDVLTDLYNRRFIMDKFVSLSQKATKRGLKMAVLISDVNDFKKVNDQHGHDYGDIVLMSIAKSLKNVFNKPDIIARWGGDEFLVLATFSNADELNKKIHNFQRNLSSITLEEQETTISVSIGYAIYPTDHTNLDELISMADAKMYEIKLSHKEKNK
ncbi:MAG TPA: GGDEF domain-containing protein [Ureibacillus sp.]|nr:GGDEF domain-containing protein [Ureibacillus sp.]